MQEVAFTLANGIAYVQAALDAGLEVDEFGPRLAFFFNGHNNVFQEVAKFRAARRMWAHIMRERFGATDERVAEAALPHADRRRDADRAAAGEQHRARGAAGLRRGVRRHAVAAHQRLRRGAGAAHRARGRIALRTQQIIAHESGAADTVDPFAGSYFVEALTDEIEARAQELIDKVDELGGSVNAIPFIKGEIEESAWGYEERYRSGQDIVVGVNKYVDGGHRGRGHPARRPGVRERAGRAAEGVQGATATRSWSSAGSRSCARPPRGTDNLLPFIREALRDACSMGEVCGAMRDVFGEYQPDI